MTDDRMSISQPAENLRYLLWKAGVDRSEWVVHLRGWVRCDIRRAEELLRGAKLRTEEQERIAQTTDVRDEDLQYTRLVATEDILLENLRYLLDSLGHGKKALLAKTVGVHYTTISRWNRGDQRPTKAHLEGISCFFGLASRTDLGSDCLFLSLSPVSDLERREWLHRRIKEADPETLKKYFPTFRRLLEDS